MVRSLVLWDNNKKIANANKITQSSLDIFFVCCDYYYYCFYSCCCFSTITSEPGAQTTTHKSKSRLTNTIPFFVCTHIKLIEINDIKDNKCINIYLVHPCSFEIRLILGLNQKRMPSVVWLCFTVLQPWLSFAGFCHRVACFPWCVVRVRAFRHRSLSVFRLLFLSILLRCDTIRCTALYKKLTYISFNSLSRAQQDCGYLHN